MATHLTLLFVRNTFLLYTSPDFPPTSEERASCTVYVDAV